MTEIILAQAELKKREKSDFLNIEANFAMDDKDVSDVTLEGGGADICYYMAICPERYTSLKGNNDCVLKEADNEEIFADGKVIDVKVNSEEDGEEFDVLEDYQRKGYGTAFIRELLKIAHLGGVKTAYVVTYSEKTAKDMYTKCRFKIVGEKRNFYYSL